MAPLKLISGIDLCSAPRYDLSVKADFISQNAMMRFIEALKPCKLQFIKVLLGVMFHGGEKPKSGHISSKIANTRNFCWFAPKNCSNKIWIEKKHYLPQTQITQINQVCLYPIYDEKTTYQMFCLYRAHSIKQSEKLREFHIGDWSNFQSACGIF